MDQSTALEASLKTLTEAGKPVRGIDWTQIFFERPELDPPGYLEILKKIRVAKLS